MQTAHMEALEAEVNTLTPWVTALREEVGKVIVGQRYLVDRLLIGLLARGHLLLEGVPGLAKTTAVRTLASALDLSFSRIQFTPDLLPADLLGTQIYNPREGSFTTRTGPVFAHLVLADEINRAPAKVQSALLEAMQEGQVTLGERSHQLPSPFLVLATQNPIEQEGTYPLPEAQLDRFMFLVRVDYPTAEEEVEVVRTTTGAWQEPLEEVLAPERIRALQDLVPQVPVSEHVVRYAVDLVRRSRPGVEGTPGFIDEFVAWGAGPRASQYLVLGSKARAVLRGRYAAEAEDVRALALPVLRHRLVVNFHAEAEGVSADDLVRRLLDTVPEPAA